MSRISCAGGVFMAGAGAGVAEGGRDRIGLLVVDEVVSLEAANFCPIAEVSCVGAQSLRQLRGLGEPSMKAVLHMPGREAGLLANAKRSPMTSWVS